MHLRVNFIFLPATIEFLRRFLSVLLYVGETLCILGTVWEQVMWNILCAQD